MCVGYLFGCSISDWSTINENGVQKWWDLRRNSMIYLHPLFCGPYSVKEGLFLWINYEKEIWKVSNDHISHLDGRPVFNQFAQANATSYMVINNSLYCAEDQGSQKAARVLMVLFLLDNLISMGHSVVLGYLNNDDEYNWRHKGGLVAGGCGSCILHYAKNT